MSEQVVLVNEKNEETGLADKDTVHTNNTPLHRGFSVFLFNTKRKLLIQQRSHLKKTFPLLWSNSCCGHPGTGETVENAARRRLLTELGIKNSDIKVVLPDFKYTAEQSGIMENEICPVMVAFSDDIIKINYDEVEKTRWVTWNEFMQMVKNDNKTLSSWSKEEAILLERETDKLSNVLG